MVLALALCFTSVDIPKKLPAPGYISPTLRALLDKRMEQHGRFAIRLTIGVVLLSYDEVGEVALQMSEEAGLAKPRLGEIGTLNATLPPLFFLFQEQLRTRAAALSRVAGERNNAKLNTAFHRLTETCMACHAVYLNGPGSHEEWWPTHTAKTP